MRLLSGIALVVVGTLLAALAVQHLLEAGVSADREQIGGSLEPLTLILALAGVVTALAGLLQLFRCWERWRDSR
ncbi:hypothetical protein EDF54_1730 [Rathayibacter sp. PhB93]|jgi:hypothetical protein|nr:hypothetical protein EDF54_1730 [Rathayibacter sp. PhB93]TDQ14518.1 hypothetical protein EDF17_1549 [Rathayibacter sp. PhB1]